MYFVVKMSTRKAKRDSISAADDIQKKILDSVQTLTRRVEDLSSRVIMCDQLVNKCQQTVADMKHSIEHCMLTSESALEVAKQNKEEITTFKSVVNEHKLLNAQLG